MNRAKAFCFALAVLLGASGGAQDRDLPTVIGHASLPRMDLGTVQRLYTGRAVEVSGTSVTVVNAAPGSKLRERFMTDLLGQDDSKYVAYWTVRKHVGKGTPPRDLKSPAEIIEFVQNTPGAMGYVFPVGPEARVERRLQALSRRLTRRPAARAVRAPWGLVCAAGHRAPAPSRARPAAARSARSPRSS